MKLYKTLLSLIAFLSIASLNAVNTPNYDRFMETYPGRIFLDNDTMNMDWIKNARESLLKDNISSDDDVRTTLMSKISGIVKSRGKSSIYRNEPDKYKAMISDELANGIAQLNPSSEMSNMTSTEDSLSDDSTMDDK